MNHILTSIFCGRIKVKVQVGSASIEGFDNQVEVLGLMFHIWRPPFGVVRPSSQKQNNENIRAELHS